MADFHLNLETDPVSEAHPVPGVTVSPDMSVRQVLSHMRSVRTGTVLVCEGDKLRGIFTERDALRMMANGANFDQPIAKVMAAKPATIAVTATVGDAIRKMSEGGYRRLPMVDVEGRLQGLVKVSGIVRYLVEHFPERVYNLPPVPKPIEQREGA